VTVILHALLLDLPERLETERLVLRATRAGEGAAVSEAVAESFADLKRWMPWARQAMTPEDCERHCRDMQAKWHSRETLDFCLFRRTDTRLVGKGGLHTIDWAVPKFEIGYWIRSRDTRQGIATEATRALADFAHATLGAKRLEITSDARNQASRRVAEKSGFVLEGVLRQSRRDVAGALADSCMYARIF
jgi:RimJ/RimL family protein N-acetyltransferase